MVKIMVSGSDFPLNQSSDTKKLMVKICKKYGFHWFPVDFPKKISSMN